MSRAAADGSVPAVEAHDKDVPAWAIAAQAAAKATGQTFVIGCYSHRDDWFANCDGVEWQGSTLADAVGSVVRELRQRTSRTRLEAVGTQMSAANALLLLEAAEEAL
jgi:hypothetical protein